MNEYEIKCTDQPLGKYLVSKSFLTVVMCSSIFLFYLMIYYFLGTSNLLGGKRIFQDEGKWIYRGIFPMMLIFLGMFTLIFVPFIVSLMKRYYTIIKIQRSFLMVELKMPYIKFLQKMKKIDLVKVKNVNVYKKHIIFIWEKEKDIDAFIIGNKCTVDRLRLSDEQFEKIKAWLLLANPQCNILKLDGFTRK